MLGVLSGIAGGLWGALAFHATARMARIPDLPSPPGEPSDEAVTAVVPARDEEARVAETVRRLRAQRGVRVRVVAVDDRSRDATGAILDRLAAEDPGVTVVHVDELPPGWLGKPHACAQGADAADPPSDWLLFADADTWVAPDALARAVGAARAADAAHVCIAPALEHTTWTGRAVLAALAPAFLAQADGPNRDRPRGYVGVGAFNLVRREAYRAIGGHEAMRAEVIDDVELGRLIRAHGLRSRMYFGVDAASVVWVTDARSYFRATEKNAFAALRFSIARAAAAVLLGASLWTVAVAGPWIGGVGGWLGAAGLVSLTVPAAVTCRRFGWSTWHGLLAPLLLPVALAGIVWSTARTLRYGVLWRGTVYDWVSLR